MTSPGRRTFTAELQLKQLRTRGRPPSANTPSGTQPNEDLYGLIERLREDIDALRTEIHRDRGGNAEPHEGVGKLQEIATLKTELRALAFCIEQTKAEIAALRSSEQDSDRLKTVTSELDAVISATEGATQQILDASEHIETLARSMRPYVTGSFAEQVLEDLVECTTSIFEACNFQDITGQRITKIVRTLQYVEDRINSMIEIWGAEALVGTQLRGAETRENDDSQFLNGPQLGGEGISQDEIDKLFG